MSISIPITRASVKEYYGLASFSERQEYHSRIRKFVSNDSILVEWDLKAGVDVQLKRITIISPSAAAELLAIELPWETAKYSINQIKPLNTVDFPSISRLINEWKHGKQPNKISYKNVHQIIDAIKVINAARELGKEDKDILVRRLSVQLFGNSKRIENLSRQIAFLLGEPGLATDVFSTLGLVKHPQPMLISGSVNCNIRTDYCSFSLIKPYLGVRPDVLKQVLKGEKLRCLITVENLASFNEAAEFSDNPQDIMILYVAGNPTPSLLSAYGRVLNSANPDCILHWGDIDLGGFRAAARLANTAKTFGYRLNLWKMNPSQLNHKYLDKVDKRKLHQIQALLIQFRCPCKGTDTIGWM